LGLLVALQFLTTIPIKLGFSTEQIGRSTVYFPIVGIIIGAILVALNFVFGLVLPPSLVNILLVIAMVLLSGGLHLDGLVDTCDGIAGNGTPEERWKVMHDSRAGGFGIIGAALLLLIKFVALNNVPQSLMISTLLTAPVISRWAMVYAIFSYPYARPSGLGKAFKQATDKWKFLLATIITVVLSAGLFKLTGLVMLAGLVIILITWLFVTVVAFYLKKKFGGLTGDTYGAIHELTETVVFILVSALSYINWLI
jgi:adenosylcobinamide-GDP ribazoletransferase